MKVNIFINGSQLSVNFKKKKKNGSKLYYKETPFIVFICNKKRVRGIFLKCKLQIVQFLDS